MKPSEQSEQVQSTTVTVARSVKVGGGEAASGSDLPQTIEVHRFATAPANVYVSVPIKLAKNYNSAGVTIGVSLPCYAEEIEEGMKKAMDIAYRTLHEQIPDLQKLVDRLGEL